MSEVAIPDQVLDFYKTLPFNLRTNAQDAAQSIKQHNQIETYADLHGILSRGVSSILDVGCGPGWFANTAATYYQAEVCGVDFNPVAIERAQEVARLLGVGTRFQVADLFEFEPAPCSVVNSLGVLHHTQDFPRATRTAAGWVAPGGYLHLGLYHEYGRAPFLRHFDELRSKGATDDQMLAAFSEMHALDDEVHLRSWYRDQVLHPHETQHTLRELVEILEPLGFRLVSTSINRFAPLPSLEQLFSTEPDFADIGERALDDGRYFPGFFTGLFQRS